MAFATFDFEKTMAPAKTLTELNLKNMEKFVGYNVELYSKYSAMTLDTTREVLSLSGLEQAQEYFKKQPEKAKEVADTMVADAKVAAEMGKEYSEELRKVLTTIGESTMEAVKTAAETTVEAAKEAPKAAAKKAPAKAEA